MWWKRQLLIQILVTLTKHQRYENCEIFESFKNYDLSELTDIEFIVTFEPLAGGFWQF